MDPCDVGWIRDQWAAMVDKRDAQIRRLHLLVLVMAVVLIADGVLLLWLVRR